MTVSNTPGVMKKSGRAAWKFQTTFSTPLKSLDAFVSTILPDHGGFERASVTIDEIVFDPKTLNALLANSSLSANLGHDWSIADEGKENVRKLLVASLSDWVDFLFVPVPKPFVIYADHDEFTTFYANTKSNLNRVVPALLDKGFSQVPDYQRRL